VLATSQDPFARVPFVVSPLLSLVFGQVREDAIYRVSRGQRLRRCHKVLDVEGRKISSGEGRGVIRKKDGRF